MEGVSHLSLSFIHTGDVHIGRPFAGLPTLLRNKRRQEVLNTFLEIIDYAYNKEVDFLFIAGDLMDHQDLKRQELKALKEGFEKIPNIHICLIAGNHDPLLQEADFYNKIDWGNNVHILTHQPLHFKDKDTIIYGQSWKEKVAKDTIDMPKLPMDGYHILLAHGDVDGSGAYNTLSKSYLEEQKFDYVAMGHIHKPQALGERIYYCGSPEALGFGEEGEHGFIYGTLDDRHNISITMMPLSHRQYIHLDIPCNADTKEEELLQQLKQELQKNHLYRLRLQGDYSYAIDPKRILKQAERLCFYAEAQEEREENMDIEHLLKIHDQDLIGEFIRYMQSKPSNEVRERALEIGIELLLKEEGMGL